MHLILSLVVSTAHAGLVSKICSFLVEDAFDHLEVYSDDDLARRLEWLEVRAKWSRITPAEERELEKVRDHIALREMILSTKCR